ncbi:DUF6056 family protein [Staphylococcus caeli]|uniref:Glucosyltransferase n=1 Tax=Staphylococcus caeli TaxID=2201815 RepID=A0A1D4JUN2_9STAP|nr:DUF6056 family protein [Staphylococcus caeli]SCS65261.1 glucosyltransferase [Staphylococcus caeli]SCS87512.1 glucosyltransferase [Staphylococcus caeli]
MRMLTINKTYLIIAGLFIFYILIGIFTPLTHDDWDWYSQYGIQMLQERFANLNGRYLGNMLEIVAVRVDWFRWLTYAVMSTLILWVISRFSNHSNDKVNYMLAFVLMLTIPSEIYKQTYGWFAGFYNYVPATFCALFIIWYIVSVLFKNSRLSPTLNIVFYVVCFVGQFFMENTTLFNTMILFVAIILHIILYKKANPKFIVGMLVSISGTLIMFLNPNYRKIFFEGSDYQNVSSDTGLIDKVYLTLTTTMPDWLFFNQIVILMLIIGVLLFMIYRNTSVQGVKKYFIVSGLILLPVYYFLIYRQFELQNAHMITITNILNTIVCFAFLCAFILAIHTLIFEKEVKYTLFFLIGSIIFVSAPLIIVSPIGPRNFYTIYVIYVVILVILISRLELCHRISIRGLIGATVLFALMYLSAFYFIHHENESRIAQLKTDIKAHPKSKEYTMEKLPFEHYLHHATPTSSKYQKLFNQYEGIPENTKVKYVPFGTKEN